MQSSTPFHCKIMRSGIRPPEVKNFIVNIYNLSSEFTGPGLCPARIPFCFSESHYTVIPKLRNHFVQLIFHETGRPDFLQLRNQIANQFFIYYHVNIVPSLLGQL